MNSMTPLPTEDTITTGQIGKLQDIVGAFLRKSNFSRVGLQNTLENEKGTFTKELELLLRRHIEANSDVLVRKIRPDLTCGFQETCNFAGIKVSTKHVGQAVLDAILLQSLEPFLDEHGEMEVFFFQIKRTYLPSLEELVKEFEMRGLVQAPPCVIAICIDVSAPLPSSRHSIFTWQKFTSCVAPFNECCSGVGFTAGKELFTCNEKELCQNSFPDYNWYAGVRKPVA